MKSFALALVVAIPMGACTMNDLDSRKYVTIEEAESAVGEHGLHVEKDTQGAFHYMRADHTPLLRVRVGGVADYTRWRTTPEALRGPLAGLAEEAYAGPIGGPEATTIAMKKDSRAVEITAVAPMTYARLYALATTAASRM